MRTTSLVSILSIVNAIYVAAIQPAMSQSASCTLRSNGSSITFGRSLTNGGVRFTCDNGVIVGPTGHRFEPGETVPISGIRAQASSTQQQSGSSTQQQSGSSTTTRSTTSSSSSSNGGALLGVAALAGLYYWWSSGDGEDSLISFRPIPANNSYNHARQWIGIEHNVSDDVYISLGAFWLAHDKLQTLLPSEDNIGAEFVLSYGQYAEPMGQLSLTSSYYHLDRLQDLDTPLRALIHDDAISGVWDERITLTWDKTF